MEKNVNRKNRDCQICGKEMKMINCNQLYHKECARIYFKERERLLKKYITDNRLYYLATEHILSVLKFERKGNNEDHEEKYKQCAICGKDIISRNPRNQSYCFKCAKEIEKQRHSFIKSYIKVNNVRSKIKIEALQNLKRKFGK